MSIDLTKRKEQADVTPEFVTGWIPAARAAGILKDQSG